MNRNVQTLAVIAVIGVVTMLLSFAAEFFGIPGWTVPALGLVLLFVGTPETGKKVNSLLNRLLKELGV